MRERYDDFAWENDKVAHRMYGAALETWQAEPLTSSTVDVWCKRTSRLVVNDWYMVDDYHHDTGEGADLYSAGKSRGAGGSGVWKDGRLFVVEELPAVAGPGGGAGPPRLRADVRGVGRGRREGLRDQARHARRGSRASTASRASTRSRAAGPSSHAAGLKKAAGAAVRVDKAAGTVRTWEALKDDNGNLGLALVVDPRSLADVVEADGNVLAVGKPARRCPAVHWAGSAWDRSGEMPTRRGVGPRDRGVRGEGTLAPEGRSPESRVRSAMENRLLVDPVRAESMSAAELRAAFLVEDLFAPGEVRLVHWEAERTIVGSAAPLATPLTLEAPPEIKVPLLHAPAASWASSTSAVRDGVSVDGVVHPLGHRERTLRGERGRRGRLRERFGVGPGALLPRQLPFPRRSPDENGDARRGRDAPDRRRGPREREGPPTVHPRGRASRAASS